MLAKEAIRRRWDRDSLEAGLTRPHKSEVIKMSHDKVINISKSLEVRLQSEDCQSDETSKHTSKNSPAAGFKSMY